MNTTWLQTNQNNIPHHLWPAVSYLYYIILREYHIHSGKTEMAASLKKQFPGEEEAIDEFMRLMKVERVGGNDNHDGDDGREGEEGMTQRQ